MCMGNTEIKEDSSATLQILAEMNMVRRRRMVHIGMAT